MYSWVWFPKKPTSYITYFKHFYATMLRSLQHDRENRTSAQLSCIMMCFIAKIAVQIFVLSAVHISYFFAKNSVNENHEQTRT